MTGYAHVTGRVIAPVAQGGQLPEAMSGTVQFVPEFKVVPTDDALVLPGRVSVDVDAEGNLEWMGADGVDLFSPSDDDQYQWTWRVESKLKYGGSPVPLKPYSIKLYAGETVELQDLSPLPGVDAITPDGVLTKLGKRVEANESAIEKRVTEDTVRSLDADVLASAKSYSDTAVELAAKVQGYIPAQSDLDTYKDTGDWLIQSATTAPTMAHWPSGAPASTAQLTVRVNAQNYGFQWLSVAGRDPQVWMRGMTSVGTLAWDDWVRVGAPAGTTGAYEHGDLPKGTDLDTIHESGHYAIRTNSLAASMINWPPYLEGWPGHLEVLGASNKMTVQRATGYSSRQSIWVRAVSSVTSGKWSEWSKVWPLEGTDPVPSGEPADRVLIQGASVHEDAKSRYFARRGGAFGTGGKPAVALRFDHHWDSFYATVLPLLKERGLPWAQVMNPDTVNNGKDDNVSVADMYQAMRDTGGEVWNHGGDHKDASTDTTIKDQIVGAKTRLETMFPALPVECWAPPGLGDGGYDGASPFKTVAQNSQTYAGQLITGHHAVVAGYAPGLYRNLRRDMQIGAPHYTMDKLTDKSTVVAALDAIQTETAGLALMGHPNYVGQDGYISVQTLTDILDEVAKRRDAGEIEVVSYSSLWMADQGETYRHDIIPPATEGTITATAPLSSRWSANRREHLLGASRELVAMVSGSAGTTVTLAATGSTLDASRSFVLTGDPQRLGLVFTPPLDHTGWLTVSVSADQDVTVSSMRCPVL